MNQEKKLSLICRYLGEVNVMGDNLHSIITNLLIDCGAPKGVKGFGYVVEMVVCACYIMKPDLTVNQSLEHDCWRSYALFFVIQHTYTYFTNSSNLTLIPSNFPHSR